jgi:hypothetical protein
VVVPAVVVPAVVVLLVLEYLRTEAELHAFFAEKLIVPGYALGEAELHAFLAEKTLVLDHSQAENLFEVVFEVPSSLLYHGSPWSHGESSY